MLYLNISQRILDPKIRLGIKSSRPEIKKILGTGRQFVTKYHKGRGIAKKGLRSFVGSHQNVLDYCQAFSSI